MLKTAKEFLNKVPMILLEKVSTVLLSMSSVIAVELLGSLIFWGEPEMPESLRKKD